MSSDPRVQSLLEELLDSGGSPEEVCRDAPELLAEVRDRWRAALDLADQLGDLFPEPRLVISASGGTEECPDIPGYEMYSVLGWGGMGVVYKARHLRLNRPVALKMLLAGAYARTQDRERLLREAEAVAGLKHANIVQVHDIGDHQGRPYFTMEFMEGGSLAQSLGTQSRTVRESAATIAALANAIHEAHVKGIVHRDLKPANVLLTSDGQPKIGDFGLARRLDGETRLTRTGAAIGTPSYMAPEQARGESADIGAGVDIYALGAILYEMLTGRPPFVAESGAATIQQLLSLEPVPPSRLNPKVPRDLEVICLKCLRKEPQSRYASAAALHRDLNCFLNGEAIEARSERWPERLSRRIRRRPALSILFSLTVVSLAALLVLGLWFQSERAAEASRRQERLANLKLAVADDLQLVYHNLERSQWSNARAGLERSQGRLGDSGPAELRGALDDARNELQLAEKLDTIRVTGYSRVESKLNFAQADREYAIAFEEAGLGVFPDPPNEVAQRIRDSHITSALVSALDHWTTCVGDQEQEFWLLKIARLADPDPTGWRDRVRDPAIRQDEEVFEGLVANAPVNEASPSLMLALDVRLRGTSRQHEQLLSRLQLAHPDDFWVNLRSGQLEYVRGRKKEAAGHFRVAVALRPETSIAWNNLGLALAASGEHEASISYFRRAIQLDPSAAAAQSNLALELWRSAQYPDAITELHRAIELSPNAAIHHTALGYALEQTSGLSEALAEHRKAVSLEPKNVEACQGLQKLLVKLGRTSEAISAWRDAIDSNPQNHATHYGFAEFCLFSGDEIEYGHARTELLSRFGNTDDPYIAERVSRACLLRPAEAAEASQIAGLAGLAASVEKSQFPGVYAHFQFAYALSEYRQERFESAIELLQGEAAPMAGPAPRLVLAMALHRAGRTKDAELAFERAKREFDWNLQNVRDQDGWICHVLRRETEALLGQEVKGHE